MSYKQKQVEQKQPDYTIRIKRLMEAYDMANLVYVLTADDDKEMEFYNATKINKAYHQTFIPNIYRLKTNTRFVYGNVVTDEVLIAYKQQTCQLFSGRHIEDNRMHEVIFKPITRADRNAEGIAATYKPIRYEPLFYLPFTPKAVDDLVKESLTGIKNFYVGTASEVGPETTTGDVYSIKNKEDFKRGSWAELIDMGRYNYSTPDPALDHWREEGDYIKKTNKSLVSVNPNAKI